MIHRIGSVSYLNSKPLIEGLDQREDVSLQLAVPARLLELLTKDVCDVALLPTFDYHRSPDLVVVPAGCIGADGAVLTVQLFSRRPISEIRSLALDRESHTSNVLVQIILKEAYKISPQILEDAAGVDARLLIGDKVVTSPPADMPYQIDLGEAWKKLTGLPFVFAMWMGPRQSLRPGITQTLCDALAAGRASLDQIVARYATPHGWPLYLARHYLAHIIRFDLNVSLGSPQRQSIEFYYQLAAKHGLLRMPVRALESSEV